MDTVVWGLALVWWIVIGAVLCGLLILVLATLPVARRLPALRRGGLRLQRQSVALEALQERSDELQRRSDELAAKTVEVQARMARVQRRARAGAWGPTFGKVALSKIKR